MNLCPICNLKEVKDVICIDCRAKLKDDLYAVIGLDSKLSTDTMPYRAGLMVWITVEMVGALFNGDTILNIMETGYVYADENMMKLIASIYIEDGKMLLPRPDVVTSVFCEFCELQTGPDHHVGCNQAGDPRCAWHIKK